MTIPLQISSMTSLREAADKYYITARMTYRARLIQPFLWPLLHCLGRYAKGILLYNRIKAPCGHAGISRAEAMKKHGKFQIVLDAEVVKFTNRLESGGAKFRDYESACYNKKFDIIRLDKTVWRSVVAARCRTMT